MNNLELPIPLNDEVWKKAIAKAKTKWLQKYLQEILPQILSLTDSDLEQAKEWDDRIRAFFDERGLSDLSQQKNRFTDIRNAIKTIDPQHPALNYIGLSPDEWIEVNAKASSSTDNRTTQLIKNPEAVVEKASSLLLSRQWSQVAAGLAVVTGRRVSEILQTAKFDKVSTYIVLFSGAAKRRDESIPLKFQIPTLVKAESVIDAIAYLRTQLNTEGLDNRQINERYESKVARECDRSFRDLIPLRDGKTNLYTHLFRSVYATIATHWYCPRSVSDLEFRAYIQGHFQIIDEPDRQRRLSLASEKHYWDYKIDDGSGNIDGRLGIKLHDPEVEVVDYFTPSKELTAPENLGRLVSLKVWSCDRDTLAHFQQQFDLDNRHSTNHFILDTFSHLLDTADKLNTTPRQLLDSLTSEGNETNLQGDPNPPELQIEKDTTPKIEQDDSDHIKRQKTNGRTQTLPKLPQSPTTALESKISRQQQSMSDLTAAIHRLVDTMTASGKERAISPPPPSQPVSTAKSLPTETGSSPKESTYTKQPVKEEQSLSPRKKYSREKSQLVNVAIDRIIAFNNQPNRLHDDKWLITVNGLMRLADCGQSIVYRVYKSREDDINAHHQLHQLDSTHNKKDKSHPKIEQVIHLD